MLSRRQTAVWLFAAFGVSVAIGYSQGARKADASHAAPSPSAATGNERLFLFIGSSTCSFSNVEGLPATVRELKAQVEKSARRDGRRFISVGIAKDIDVAEGLRHLAKFGPFDEVSVGRNWANIGLLKYLHGQFPGPAATPQILVLDRLLINEGGYVGVRDEAVVTRRVGLAELREWARDSNEVPVEAKDSDSGRPH